MGHEQQVVYYTAPMSYEPAISNQQTLVYAQHIPSGQMINQHTAMGTSVQPNQLHAMHYTNLLPQRGPESNMHTNTLEQQAYPASHQTWMNAPRPAQQSSTMKNQTSTPISAQNKRGRNDTSGLSETNVQLRPQQDQMPRGTYTSNTPNKRIRGFNQQKHNEKQSEANRQDGTEQGDHGYTAEKAETEMKYEGQQPSEAARRYATSRFPFSPFSVTFAKEAKEKTMIEELTKHATSKFGFDLKIVAYRRGRSDGNEHRILIFVENSQSFAFLYEQTNWPPMLAENAYTMKSPSIPPQLALVLPYVALQTDWEEFVQELKENYTGVAEVIRLKNKAQQPVRAVKLEFRSADLREELLRKGEVSVIHMKYKVVEYYAQANVLICSNCYGIGHFRKNCPQREECTCRTCGEKCQNIKEHQCSGVPKCIHCGGPHISNDNSCKVVKDYRAALTRNLLAKENTTNGERRGVQVQLKGIMREGTATSGMAYSTVAQMAPGNANEILLKKLDAILAKVDEESNETKQAFRELKDNLGSHYEETKLQVQIMETKVKAMEMKFEELIDKVSLILENTCKAFLDPKTTIDENWRMYWKEQISTMARLRLKATRTEQ